MPANILAAYRNWMPNIHVSGLDRAEALEFSRLVADVFAREFATAREHVYVFRREVEVLQDGEEVEPPVLIRLSWIRRAAGDFEAAAQALTAIVRGPLRRVETNVQVELHEKWEDAVVDGVLCSDWAAANRGR